MRRESWLLLGHLAPLTPRYDAYRPPLKQENRDSQQLEKSQPKTTRDQIRVSNEEQLQNALATLQVVASILVNRLGAIEDNTCFINPAQSTIITQINRNNNPVPTDVSTANNTTWRRSRTNMNNSCQSDRGNQ